MSKSIDDYREIVKVLKLQLLKVREENHSLSKTLGVATETDTSSFTPRLQKFKQSNKQFAKFLYLFNLFAHKCELIGVSPQMVFRIADKKRDKKVAVSDLTEIMKRLKLRLDDVQISRLLGTITKSGNIFYDQYLQYLSAFQINSEVYPQKGQRNYSQLCLLKFGSQAKQKYESASDLVRQVSAKQGGPYITFEGFSTYCRNNTKLKDVEIIAAFVAMDTASQCQIQKENFTRQMNKIYNLLEKGVSYEDNYNKRDKRDEKQQQRQQTTKKNKQPTKNNKDDDQNFVMQQDTGVEAGAKAKKQIKKPVKLNKNQLVSILKKQGISTDFLISKLLQKQQKRNLIRPFGLYDFSTIIQSISKNIDKKKIMQFFKNLDSSRNGSVSTDQLVKLWIEGRQASDPSQTLFKLLARHLKQIQSKQYFTKFNTCGYEKEDALNPNVLGDVFHSLNLEEDYLKSIQANLPSKCTVSKFIQLLQSGGVSKTNKAFIPMKKSDFQTMNTMIKKLIPKEPKLFPKLCRLENKQGESQNKGFWQTIFTDEWSCWNYCLQTASKLTNFWRDPEFGPNKGDPHGYRSIVGNESCIPPGLPLQDQITWMTFQDSLQKQGKKIEQVKLFSPNLVANDIVQGKIGDCWFVSALSIITANDQLVKGKSLKQCKVNPDVALTFGVHPIMFHIFRQYGLYVFKYFKGFKPVYVVVDDLFPVQVTSNELVFAKSPDPGLQWVAFLQKSYAKLHHCYTNLISGQISQGLADMTNSLPIKQSLVNNPPDQLFKKLSKLCSENQLMGCSINNPSNTGVQKPVQLEGQRTGLFYGHAYSIGDIIDLSPISKEDYKLIRVRNPWGHGQWVLDWSDKPLNNDPQYAKLQKYQKDIDKYYDDKVKKAKQMREAWQQITKYRPGQDGQFLMNIEDFARIFSNLFTGYNIKDKNYTCYKLNGKWDNTTPSGICKAKGATDAQRSKFVKDNYQFILEVKQKTDVIMFLIQQDGRLYRGQKYPYKQVSNGIIIQVFTLQNNEKSLQKFDMAKATLPNLKLELKRETNFWHKFEAGRYAIIPCKMANKIPESQFQFRLYSEKPVVVRKINGGPGNFQELPKTTKSSNAGGLSSMVDLLVKNESAK